MPRLLRGIFRKPRELLIELSQCAAEAVAEHVGRQLGAHARPGIVGEWLARLADHIPDPGRHRTHIYAHYANRVRGERPPEEVTSHGDEPKPPKKHPCSPSSKSRREMPPERTKPRLY